MVFRAWLENFPDAEEHMLNMIEPFAQAMVGKENDKMLSNLAKVDGKIWARKRVVIKVDVAKEDG